MKSKQISVCCALAMAFSLLIGNNGAQAATSTPAGSGGGSGGGMCQGQGRIVEAIPETDFTAANSISLFSTYVTEGYPPTQLTLKSGNGVADFRQSPGFLEDQPSWYFTPNSSQIVADGTTSYTKVIPFDTEFHVRFKVQVISPSGQPIFSPFGGTIFEMHDTDPVFAKYGDPTRALTHLDESNGNYTFYVNNVNVWSAPLTLKTWDVFEIHGRMQSDTSTIPDGVLELKRNGVIVATVAGVNCHGMSPQYPVVPGTPPTPLGPPPHPLTSGPHVRLGLGHVPSASGPGVPPTVTEVYIDNVHATYRQAASR